jgi:hypothetical protein
LYYDEDRRVTSVTAYELGVDAVLAEYEYTVRADGKRTRAIERIDLDGDAALDATTIDWTYDALGRLVEERYDALDDAPVGSPTNAAGFPRNRTWFWQQVLRERPKWFSEANRARIEGRNGEAVRSPIVDDVWVRHHPEHQAFMQDTLVHHHIARGRFATPLPQRVHRAWFGDLHGD